MLIRDQSLLTTDELKFAVNSWTHLDFVIFNRMDKSAVLAVEVDGHAFHAGNEKQIQRDKLKDSILQNTTSLLFDLQQQGVKKKNGSLKN